MKFLSFCGLHMTVIIGILYVHCVKNDFYDTGIFFVYPLYKFPPSCECIATLPCKTGIISTASIRSLSRLIYLNIKCDLI